MQIWLSVFLISCFLIFYNYIGYAIIAFVLNKLKKKQGQPATEFLPSVSFIVAAYNEEDWIQAKVLNSLEQEYPAHLIEFIFITDGSTDGTMDIIKKYPTVKLLHEPGRNGKSAAINRAVKQAVNDILIFSDANTTLNEEATLLIARHYQDARTGGVAGEKKVIPLSGKQDKVGQEEGAYWKYESALKKIDSEFYSVVGAAGELFSLRRALYEPIDRAVILDDFILSLKVAQKGYYVRYEPGAYAMELPSFSMKDEQKRKERIAAGGFQSIAMLWELLLFWKQPRLSFLYISHRVMRWAVSPICLPLAFISNFALACLSSGIIFKLLFAGQMAFYLIALLPVISNVKGVLKVPYYFVFMNYSVIKGFFRFIKGSQSAAWEKVNRAKLSA